MLRSMLGAFWLKVKSLFRVFRNFLVTVAYSVIFGCPSTYTGNLDVNAWMCVNAHSLNIRFFKKMNFFVNQL